MDSSEAREVKARLRLWAARRARSLVAASLHSGLGRANVGFDRRGLTIAFGIGKTHRGDASVEVRIQSASGLEQALAEQIVDKLYDVNVLITGPIAVTPPLSSSAVFDAVCRPLKVGCSIGHSRSGSGTLGCFVVLPDGTVGIVSNNHVLAAANLGRRGDPIYQPRISGLLAHASHVVGELDRFVPIKETNVVDAAAAVLHGEDASGSILEYEGNYIRANRGAIRLNPDPIDPEVGETVMKVGRTTGLTHGIVTAIEVDALRVSYNYALVLFNDVTEVLRGARSRWFSEPGDSGLMVFDAVGHPIGLVFSGNSTTGVTYVCSAGRVLDSLNVRLDT